MDNAEIFYAWEHTSCINYSGKLMGGFKLASFDKGFLYTFEKGKTDYFLFFILEGQIDVAYNNFYKWSVKEGEMFLLSDNYCVKCITPVKLILFTSDHPGNNGSKVLRRLTSVCERIDYTYKPISICRQLMLFLNLLKFYLSDGVACGHLQEEKQEELFALLENYYTTVELAELFFPVVTNHNRDFKKLVESNYLQARTVTELIELCGYNPGCFKKTFEEVFGKPIYQWMQNQKAEHVKYRLQDVNVNFKELMVELGFDSASHFNKFCQKWLGMSPSQYVKQIKSGCNTMCVDNVQQNVTLL